MFSNMDIFLSANLAQNCTKYIFLQVQLIVKKNKGPQS